MNPTNAPTVAQVKQGPGSLWDFLLQLPATTEAQIFYGLVIGCLAGMLVHYVQKWASQEISGGLLDYLFFQYPRHTVLAVIAIGTWSAGEVASGIFVVDGTFVGWALVLLSGVKTGYMGDALINKAVPRTSSEAGQSVSNGGPA